MKTAESPTMTLAQVCTELRNHGISCTNKTVGDNIASGIYTFGRLVSTGPAGGRRFEIWRRDFNRWLDEQCGTTPQATSPAVPATPPLLDTRATQIAKWAYICTNPLHKESDCDLCPYRAQDLCMDAMLADAASALLAYANSAVCA